MFLINFNRWKCACVGVNNWVIQNSLNGRSVYSWCSSGLLDRAILWAQTSTHSATLGTSPRRTQPDGGTQQCVQLHTSNVQHLLMKPLRCSWNSVLKSSSTGFDTDQIPLGYLLLASFTVRISVDRTEALNRPYVDWHHGLFRDAVLTVLLVQGQRV